jgi:hypothetical protein
MSQMVDKVGMRFGAALSAAVLVLAFAADIEIVVPFVAAALGIGAIFGPSKSPMSMLFRGLKATLLKRIPADPEPAAPPRFAQTLGFVFLAAASVALWADAIGLGWTLALLVAVLQALLGTTGICIGCEMYLIMKKMGAKSA